MYSITNHRLKRSMNRCDGVHTECTNFCNLHRWNIQPVKPKPCRIRPCRTSREPIWIFFAPAKMSGTAAEACCPKVRGHKRLLRGAAAVIICRCPAFIAIWPILTRPVPTTRDAPKREPSIACGSILARFSYLCSLSGLPKYLTANRSRSS